MRGLSVEEETVQMRARLGEMAMPMGTVGRAVRWRVYGWEGGGWGTYCLGLRCRLVRGWARFPTGRRS